MTSAAWLRRRWVLAVGAWRPDETAPFVIDKRLVPAGIFRRAGTLRGKSSVGGGGGGCEDVLGVLGDWGRASPPH